MYFVLNHSVFAFFEIRVCLIPDSLFKRWIYVLYSEGVCLQVLTLLVISRAHTCINIGRCFPFYQFRLINTDHKSLNLCSNDYVYSFTSLDSLSLSPINQCTLLYHISIFWKSKQTLFQRKQILNLYTCIDSSGIHMSDRKTYSLHMIWKKKTSPCHHPSPTFPDAPPPPSPRLAIQPLHPPSNTDKKLFICHCKAMVSIL